MILKRWQKSADGKRVWKKKHFCVLQEDKWQNGTTLGKKTHQPIRSSQGTQF